MIVKNENGNGGGGMKLEYFCFDVRLPAYLFPAGNWNCRMNFSG